MASTRPLTVDERQASEAAFAGARFNPRWSHAACQIYDGLLAALANMTREPRRLRRPVSVPTDCTSSHMGTIFQ
jgi:hypothetical protein